MEEVPKTRQMLREARERINNLQQRLDELENTFLKKDKKIKHK